MIPQRAFYSNTLSGEKRRCHHGRAGSSSAIQLSLLVALFVITSFRNTSHALIVGTQPGLVPATNVHPLAFPGWTLGDPGWHNVAVGKNYVYLGDGWVLSARHVGYSVSEGIQFQTLLPNGSLGPITRFDRIPGTYYFDYGFGPSSTRQYAISNPASIQSETGETVSLEDSNGALYADLQLFRINGDPGLPSVVIPTQPLPQNFTRTGAPQMVAVGTGHSRQSGERTWYITINPENEEDWTWTQTEPETYDKIKQGYIQSTVIEKRFGTNRVADPHPNGPGDPEDPEATDYTGLFRDTISDTTGIVEFETGPTRVLIGMVTSYDSTGTPGVTDLEFQAQGGDSGSGVFFKRGDEWELSGILHAIDIFPNQLSTAAVYGNSTVISDLYYYNQDYPNSIRNIIEAHADYSHPGDVNLDGLVTDDDVTALYLGWGYDSGLGVGTIESWKKGDLNRDGKVDSLDYVAMRMALEMQSSGAAFSSAVPEPSEVILACAAAAYLRIAVRRRTGGQGALAATFAARPPTLMAVAH